jgi:hypothetical protein
MLLVPVVVRMWYGSGMYAQPGTSLRMLVSTVSACKILRRVLSRAQLESPPTLRVPYADIPAESTRGRHTLCGLSRGVCASREGINVVQFSSSNLAGVRRTSRVFSKQVGHRCMHAEIVQAAHRS